MTAPPPAEAERSEAILASFLATARKLPNLSPGELAAVLLPSDEWVLVFASPDALQVKRHATIVDVVLFLEEGSEPS